MTLNDLEHKNRGFFYRFYICSQWAFIYALLSRVPFALDGLSCSDCSQSLSVVDGALRQHATVLATLASVGATEMLKTLEVTGLLQLVADGNYTVFAPTNEAFDTFVPQTVRRVASVQRLRYN